MTRILASAIIFRNVYVYVERFVYDGDIIVNCKTDFRGTLWLGISPCVTSSANKSEHSCGWVMGRSQVNTKETPTRRSPRPDSRRPGAERFRCIAVRARVRFDNGARRRRRRLRWCRLWFSACSLRGVSGYTRARARAQASGLRSARY